MRIGERAKIKIKKKFAFGRPGEIDKLKFPPNCDIEKLKSKAVIYQVTLLETACDIDFVKYSYSIYQTIEDPFNTT